MKPLTHEHETVLPLTHNNTPTHSNNRGVQSVAKVVVYTKAICPYCVRAKNLLTHKGVVFEEINLSGHPDEFQALKERTGMMTVPQIFINGSLVGGYDQLAELEAQGKLDALLDFVR